MSISRQWLDVARSAFLEEIYRGRSVLCVGVGDGRAIEVLLARGASRVVGVDGDGQAVAAATRLLGKRAELRAGSAATVNGRFDVVFVAAGETLLGSAGELSSLCERVAPGGWLVATAGNGDRAGADGGVGYYDLVDALAPNFPSVTMMGAAPFWGAALAPFGEEEVEPSFDGTLHQGEARLYVAVAGPRALQLGYGLIALPPAATDEAREPSRAREREHESKRVRDEAQHELARARDAASESKRQRDEAQHELARAREAAQGETKRARDEAQRELSRARDEAQRELSCVRDEAQRVRDDLARAHDESQVEARRLRETLTAAQTDLRRARDEAKELAARASQLAQNVEAERRRADASLTVELTERLAVRERGMEELGQTAVLHAEELRAVEARIGERDAYIAELEEGARAQSALRVEMAAQSARSDAAEIAERDGRRRIAVLEGTLARHGIALPEGGAAVAVDDGRAAELEKKIAELEARGAKLEAKASDAQREAWAHMKARSDAEAAAAEVREDTVRKLKDARKVANIELMRAMEEATRKAVSLKEELTRTEAERREAIAALKGMREEHSSLLAEVAELRARRDRVFPSVSELKGELDRIAELVDGEGARLGGIEEGLRRAVAAVAAAEHDLDLGGGAR